jgi:AraC-like DNA-binding protein
MAEVTFEYKLLFDNTWVYNYASFIEKHCWQQETPEPKHLVLPNLFSEGFLKHWTLEEGFSAIYNSYIQKVDVRHRITSESGEPYYYIYFDLSESASIAALSGAEKDPEPGIYTVYYGMSSPNSEFLVHHNSRAHGLQLLIKQEAFDQYFTHSHDSAANLEKLREALHPGRFHGSMPMSSKLILSLMKLPRHVDTEELDIYYIRGYIYNILSLFLASLLNPSPAVHSQHLAGLCRLIEANEEIAEKTEEEQPSLDEAARRACMCSTKFKKLFRIAYNTTYHKYHQRIRLLRAKELFQFSNASITNVVRDLGYKNAGHFARLFKEQFSISPKDYQRQFDALV